ncbi:hypothetical protein F53441_13615 [Fusarium austroafricanum]|uniref:Chromo domain-containing protein n=1 Tax=Fusarium austroafricanum TaxID=2364996 RepID=A0A8H4NKA4_9HYPO|nr:hypothetical protein F53441_13615 [Fusarium austroafricanum]
MSGAVELEAATYIPTKILGHTIEEDAKVSFHVCFGPVTQGKISEFEAQELKASLVYAYWRRLGGRNEATGLDVYHPFDILSHEIINCEVFYQVQWIGYSTRDTTFEEASMVEGMCAELKHEYDVENGLVRQ